jgi:hypothetical protein
LVRLPSLFLWGSLRVTAARARRLGNRVGHSAQADRMAVRGAGEEEPAAGAAIEVPAGLGSEVLAAVQWARRLSRYYLFGVAACPAR